jgi:hypothetical protein
VRLRFQPWLLVSLSALGCALLILAVHFFWSPGGVLSPQELVDCLPGANATLVYIDVNAIRRAGILDKFAGPKAAEEIEYRQFVGETKFDYRQDLDAVAAAFKGGQVYLALRGRFHWKNLRDYAARQGGSCHDNFCVLAASQPNRRISFYPLGSNLLAMAISTDDFAAYLVKRQRSQMALPPPNQPLWVVVPAATLQNTDALPADARPYLSALQNAEQIVFSLGPDADHFELALHVTCRDAAAASALLANFEGATSTLRKWIGRAHQPATPADLASLLVAGAFRRDDRQVYGQWPIPKAFVDTIAGGSY